MGCNARAAYGVDGGDDMEGSGVREDGEIARPQGITVIGNEITDLRQTSGYSLFTKIV